MSCPKCKSENVTAGTAGTLRCNDCDFAWVAGNTAPRYRDAGVKKTSPAGLIVLILLFALTAVAAGFVSAFAALVVGLFGLLAAILFFVARIAGGGSPQ